MSGSVAAAAAPVVTDPRKPAAERKSLYGWLASIYELGEAGSSKRMQAMEGLRGLAILLVFLCHYYDIIYRHLPLNRFLARIGMGVMEAGGTGVALFFVLSGMLIYRAVLRPDLNLKKFLLRRVERIYPTFIAIFVVYLAMDAYLTFRPKAAPYDVRIPSDPIAAAEYLLANLTFIPGMFPVQPLLNVAWSLSYEWMFYLVLPLVAMILGLSSWKARQRILVCLSLALILGIATLLMPDFFYLSSNPIRTSHVWIIMFLGGMAISDLLSSGVSNPHKWIDWTALAILGLGLLVPFAYGFFDFRSAPRGPAIVKTEAIISCSLFVAYGLAVFYTLSGQHLLNRIFSWAPLRWLGNMSYSFYLVHGLPMHIAAMLVARTHLASLSVAQQVAFIAAFLPVTFIGTAAVSTVLFVLVEKPFSLRPKRTKAA